MSAHLPRPVKRRYEVRTPADSPRSVAAAIWLSDEEVETYRGCGYAVIPDGDSDGRTCCSSPARSYDTLIETDGVN